MQTHLRAPATRTRTSGRRRRTTIAGLSLALPLALAVAIGLVQISGNDAAGTAEPTAVAEAHHALVAEGAALAEAPRRVVYIVETQEQADHALRFIAEMNALRAELGQPQVSVGVLVAGTESTMALDGLPGAPDTRFFDLRTP